MHTAHRISVCYISVYDHYTVRFDSLIVNLCSYTKFMKCFEFQKKKKK